MVSWTLVDISLAPCGGGDGVRLLYPRVLRDGDFPVCVAIRHFAVEPAVRVLQKW